MRVTWRFSIYLLVFVGLSLVIFVVIPVAVPDLMESIPLLPVISLVISGIAFTAPLLLAPRLERRPIRDYGFRFEQRWWRDFIAGLVIGVVPAAVTFALYLPLGWAEVVETFSPGVTGSFTLWAGLFLIAFCSRRRRIDGERR